MSTPHIESKKEDIASVVIMPGDPKRCEYIAKNYLENYTLVNEVRGQTAYTGYYKGKKITVFPSGMGIPSMGIYSHELFLEYDVKAIIRIGSAGSYVEDLKIKDLILVSSSYSESAYSKMYTGVLEDTAYPSWELNDIIKETASSLNIELKSVNTHSTEAFYSNINLDRLINDNSLKCVEMETFSLFINAKKLNRKSAALLTISDSFITKQKLTSDERVSSFDKMITLALESVIKL